MKIKFIIGALSLFEASLKKHIFSPFVFVFAIVFCNAQTITFISENSNKPLPKVFVFGKDGNILAHSDIDGKIEKTSLNQSQEKFELVYNNSSLGSFSYADLDKDVVKLTDRETAIQEVVVSNKPAKYIYLQGNFNSYVTVNNKLNCYVDGIITYVFDNKTKKLKSSVINQYRVFRLDDVKGNRKKMSTLDYEGFLEIPDISITGNPEKYKAKFKDYKELKGNQKDELQLSEENLQKKEFSLFGYRFFDFKEIINVSYEKDSKRALKNLLEYNMIDSQKIKHKSESDFNTFVEYQNFYPTELSFSNEKKSDKIKFSTSNSNYQTKYWEEESFPNMQSVFKSYFKDDLKEKSNKQ